MKHLHLFTLMIVLTIAGVTVTRGQEDHDHDHDHGHADNPTEFTSVIPILNVADVPASIGHYTTVLGFTKDWNWPQEGETTFASISNGDVHVFLSKDDQGSRPTWVYYDVPDVDALHKQYLASGAKIIQPPTDQTWHMREMLVEDIDGHVLRIGSFISDDHSGHDHHDH